MANPVELREPWLVAAWPGMGSTAILAAGYLIQHLRARQTFELNSADFFEIQSLEVKNGIGTVSPLPRNMFFEWKNPAAGGHDLLIFVGEAQPATGGYALCQRVLDHAGSRGVKQFFSFAAMATTLALGDAPHVSGVATDMPTLSQITKAGVQAMAEGQIRGLNGILLATGAQRAMRGACLLGELPYFAANVANPRSALVVLEKFTELAGIKLDLADLAEQAEAVDQKLVELIEHLQQAGASVSEESEPAAYEPPEEIMKNPEPRPIDPVAQERIELMFEKSRTDRAAAFELKKELDRLGVFKQYENRFLDLFRKAG